MQFKKGIREWRDGLTKITRETAGIEWAVGIGLYVLTLTSPTQWLHIGYDLSKKSSLIDGYVFITLLISAVIFAFPTVSLAIVSTYFAASTVIVLLNTVLLRRVFGQIPSPERSLLLFICNVTQIVFMFATWYHICGEEHPLLRSVLVFATIGHSDKARGVTMLQVATDFVLLAIFLSYLVGHFGAKRGPEPDIGD